VGIRGDLKSDILSAQEEATGCEYTEAGLVIILSVEFTSFEKTGAYEREVAAIELVEAPLHESRGLTSSPEDDAKLYQKGSVSENNFINSDPKESKVLSLLIGQAMKRGNSGYKHHSTIGQD
jgi:hypothetical protein